MINDFVNVIVDRFNEIKNITIDIIIPCHALSKRVFIDVVKLRHGKEIVCFNICDMYFNECSVDVVINNTSVITFTYDDLDIDEFVGSILCKRFYDK